MNNNKNTSGGVSESVSQPPGFWQITVRTLGNFFTGVLCGITVQAVARICFLKAYAGDAFSSLSEDEKLSYIKTALLFDAKYAATMWLPLIACGLLLFWKKTSRLYSYVTGIFNYAAIIAITAFSIINHYYYQTYKQCTNAFIFALFKEDAGAVMSTVVNDYPLFTGLGLFFLGLLAYFFIFKLLSGIVRRCLSLIISEKRRILSTAVSLILLVLTGFMLRGSFGTFPLRQDNLNVSRDAVINASVGNGTAYFYWAYKWYRKENKIPAVTTEDILNNYRKLGINVENGDITAPLTVTLPENNLLAGNPPDIVVAVMESMSTHMLLLDNPEKNIDLYGALRPHAESDFFFLNFLSEGNGTADSLIRLFTEAPDLNLSTSSRYNKDYLLNTIKPFKEHGYRVIFITSGRSSWRNLGSFLEAQGVDKVIDESAIRLLYPDATAGTWGIDDEYLFKMAYEMMNHEHSQPVLIFLLTITNHPPYRVPGNNTPKSISLPDDIRARFPYEDTETIFATFRYANNSLGSFISLIKNDPHTADRTIIAATGDHNLRGIGYSKYPEEAALGHAVPFYLYMPEKYIDGTGVSYDRMRPGSHKDIMATIAAHSLSSGTMLSTGCDMLGSSPCRFPYVYNGEVILTPDDNGSQEINSYTACFDNDEVTFKSADLYDMSENILKLDTGSAGRNSGRCDKAAEYKKLMQNLYYIRAK